MIPRAPDFRLRAARSDLDPIRARSAFAIRRRSVATIRRGPVAAIRCRSIAAISLAVALVAASASCGGEAEDRSVEAAGGSAGETMADARGSVGPGGVDEAGPEETPGVAPSSPEGSESALERRISDLRGELESVELNPRESYDHVVELYETHHSWIARRYGSGGSVTGHRHPELAAAIARQDSAFQDLMELTGTTEYIERTHLLHAIRNVRIELGRIVDAARTAEVPLTPPD